MSFPIHDMMYYIVPQDFLRDVLLDVRDVQVLMYFKLDKKM